eukprot:2626691-Pyramimonas_sp.AAC.1
MHAAPSAQDSASWSRRELRRGPSGCPRRRFPPPRIAFLGSIGNSIEGQVAAFACGPPTQNQ